MKNLLLSMMAVMALVAAPFSAEAQNPGQEDTSLRIPVVGTGGGSFAGTFNLQRFVVQNGAVQAVGTLTGTLTDGTGVATSIVRSVAIPVTVGQASCDILHLELGPLSLDLLGLQVDLSRIVLDIDAQSGPGNLLGNLLCSVAGLLDNPGGLARVLDQILDIIG